MMQIPPLDTGIYLWLKQTKEQMILILSLDQCIFSQFTLQRKIEGFQKID